jgi:beta-lactamase regulating signal transducer with metallopeptidase domain
MSVIFLKLLNLSISASWLVLVVLVLRLVLKRAPKWVDVLLWGMVALRLMLPFSIESALSLIPSAETVSPEVVQFDPAPTITSGVTIIDNAVNPSLSESFAAAPLASVNPLYVWTYLAGWVWLIGLAAMLLYALVSYLRLRRRVSASIPLWENVYVCDEVPSPFILGIVHPRIYLPSALDEAQRGSVLSHERAHLARRDHWWKPLGFALLAVYWFNPLLWLAYTLLCRDIELACDERVLRGMDAGQVKDYSSALLACSVPRRMLAACPLAFGEVGVGARVKNALRYKKPAFWVVAASVAVCVVVAVCFLTNPPTDTDAAGLIGFHRERVTYADVTDESGAQPSSVQLTAEETDAVYALLDTLQYKRLGAASAMQDCYARLYFISAAGERCEIMLSEREMLVNPITDGKTARLYELRSGSTELRDYLFGCIGASEPAEEEMKTMTEPTLSLTLTVPAAWEDIAELSAYDKGTAYLGYGIMLFHLSEKNALAAYPDGGMGSVWWLDAMSWDNFKEWRGYDALPVPEILGIAEYVLGADDEYVYLLVLPSDVQWLENDPVSKAQYEQLCADSQEVLERFLNDSRIVLNEKCPDSRVFSAEKMLQEDAARDYISYLSGSTDLASAKKGSLPHCEFPGMSALTAALPLEDAEREAVLKWANTEKVDSTTRIDYYAAIAVRQHYLVLEQFGDNAWENVSYTFEKIDPVDGALGYRIIETGESIGAAEYDKILREYWDDVAKKEGVDYYDIFLPEAEPPEKMADKRVDLIAKYSEGIPVELTTISDAQACRVNLSFNGKKTSAQGFGDFHFIIDNRTGEWKAYEGLTWAEPYPGFPIGD